MARAGSMIASTNCSPQGKRNSNKPKPCLSLKPCASSPISWKRKPNSIRKSVKNSMKWATVSKPSKLESLPPTKTTSPSPAIAAYTASLARCTSLSSGASKLLHSAKSSTYPQARHMMSGLGRSGLIMLKC